MSPAVKVTTWNVNSLNARGNIIYDWIEQNDPDVLLLQETKSTDQEFPVDELGDLGYDCAYFGEKTYNGVAICAKDGLSDVRKNLPGDAPDAPRRLISAVVSGIRFVSVYVPNGQSLDSDKYPYKLDWLERLDRFLAELGAPAQPIIVSGDYNIAPTDALDVWDPVAMQGGTHVSPPERAAFQKLLDRGFVDAFRLKHPTSNEFSWWDYRAGHFQKNYGLRIDVHLVSTPLVPRIEAVAIDKKVRALGRSSDHSPVTLTLA